MPSETNPVLSAIDTAFTLPSGDVAVYFAADGETIDFVTSIGTWSKYEKAQVMAALDTYSTYADLSFRVTTDPDEADFRLTKSAAPAGSLAFMNPPDPSYGDAAGLAWFNAGFNWSGPNGGLLDAGAYTFTIFLHEFGHGLGLAHPFDASSGSTVMPSIGPGPGLDQGVYTVMTYNDGWPEAPAGSSDSRAYGWNLTPSPIDIAVIQEKYGANLATGAGRTSYVLPAENGPGTGYAAIWDVDGLDTIIHEGDQAAVIDLRAATLRAAEGGGGFVSHAGDVHGGFTIANGVVIENAIGGSGDDTIIGNSAANRLNGGAGADVMTGGKGDDIYILDDAGDETHEARGGGIDTIRTSRVDVALRDHAFVENVSLFGRRHLDAEGSRADNVIEGNRGDNVLSGGKGDDVLFGGLGFDVLDGGAGNDTLTGSLGPDTLTGGAGADTFVVTLDDGRATITDFTPADTLDLTQFGLGSFADVAAALTVEDNGTVIQLDGARVFLVGVADGGISGDMVLI
ncbi:hypothetical protein DLJ53_24005 [Acuticoccus sediminis]|uniref:Peptidase M10 serralysin C-terminal domain-containing protein n=1 Tax=Acuticoccus sediminis TaxID=2184697 RepID=A0A8B2NGU7_9HYPH|nr:M10 family metallopeptidase C-terminal domain-containing protein [Acuticoccus sediminis]RAH98711.1 hypothetical protein DLJ53_24005 [Acuticoccus sediminis]